MSAYLLAKEWVDVNRHFAYDYTKEKVHCGLTNYFNTNAEILCLYQSGVHVSLCVHAKESSYEQNKYQSCTLSSSLYCLFSNMTSE